ncbi:MAG: alpha-glucosidase, partial [Daejeonella sp.]|nr:alpha-glucosidase [Daejeonella sp.]
MGFNNGSWLDKNYCASRLRQKSPNNEYSVGFPQAPEGRSGGPVDPEAKTPWLTPWRIIAIGSLKTIVESSLGTDLAKPAIYMADLSFIKPGKASWSWIILKDSSIVYDVQKQYIDFAADMKWEYCLIDADWDKNIGYEKMKELADYAKTKNVGLLLWYNSAGDWNTVKYTPKDKLLTTASRTKEFAKLKEMGIKGIKVDFFGGDGQSVIRYYQDIFSDAAKYQLLVNCHGATLPRGWQRTYPNLMTVEAIKGEEFITFDQANADQEPAHATTIPFTRNVFDPMDFTPMNLTGIPNIERKTSSAFELALPIIFQSGIQHLAETPEGIAKVPDYVKAFLQTLPSAWLDTKFLDGYPGKYTVLARKAANGWYIAGINGETTEREVKLDMSFLTDKTKGTLITDGNDKHSFDKTEMTFSKNKMPELTMKP